MSRFFSHSPRTILVSISILHAAGRDVLSGILQRIDASKGWTIKLMQKEENPLTVQDIENAEANGVAGLIVSIVESEAVVDALKKCRVPIVTIGWAYPESFIAETRRLAYILNDGEGLGKLGAEHFLSKGRFRSYAFLGNNYLANREAAFRRALGRSAESYSSFRSHEHPGNDSDLDAIGAWLATLPRPVAVMAGCDWLGVKAISACQRAGLRIPSQVSIIGIDNDEFICEHTSPQLSSILPGHFEMGRRAVIEMERLLGNRPPQKPRRIVIPPVKIVERDSSTSVPPAVELVQRARKFIEKNACSGIGVREVVDHVRVSRRLLEIRYRQMENETVREAIERVKFSRLRQLLATTDRRISLIAAECGFTNPSVISRRFRRRTGLTMQEFRRRGQP